LTLLAQQTGHTGQRISARQWRLLAVHRRLVRDLAVRHARAETTISLMLYPVCRALAHPQVVEIRGVSTFS
jgi:hypothetical protein